MRDSKFLLLRIIAMTIVLTHLSSHVVMKVAAQDALILWERGTLVNKFFCCLMLPGGRVGIPLFFMITGFFQSKVKKRRFKKK